MKYEYQLAVARVVYTKQKRALYKDVCRAGNLGLRRLAPLSAHIVVVLRAGHSLGSHFVLFAGLISGLLYLRDNVHSTQLPRLSKTNK